jgi:hypothetical protein
LFYYEPNPEQKLYLALSICIFTILCSCLSEYDTIVKIDVKYLQKAFCCKCCENLDFYTAIKDRVLSLNRFIDVLLWMVVSILLHVLFFVFYVLHLFCCLVYICYQLICVQSRTKSETQEEDVEPTVKAFGQFMEKKVVLEKNFEDTKMPTDEHTF